MGKLRIPIGFAIALAVGSNSVKAGDASVTAPLTALPSIRASLLSAALPQELFIQPGETLRQAVTRQCLANDEAYLARLRAQFFVLNPKLKIVGANDLVDSVVVGDVRIMAPPCLLRSAHTEAEISIKGETIAQKVILASEASKKQLRTVSSQVLGGKILGGNNSFIRDPFSVNYGDHPLSYYRTSYLPYDISPADLPAAASVTSDDKVTFKVAFPKAPVLASEPDVSLTDKPIAKRGRLVVADKIDKPCLVKDLSNTSRIKEFDAWQIISAIVLDYDLQERMKQPYLRSITPTIEIADSGLYREASPALGDILSGRWDISLIPDQQYEFADHGTEVATIALGGPDIAPVNRFLFKVRMKPKQIIYRAGITQTKAEYVVDQDLLGTAMRKLGDWGGAEIVNLSVRFPVEVKEVEDAKKDGKALIVVAAGNNDSDLQLEEAWPAKYGGSVDEPVITVAAVERDGTKAPFSNYSPTHVEIAALGCDVRTWSYDPKKGRLVEVRPSGTSFAAPAVSATAAWLKHVLSDFSPVALKHHIIASADIFPNLTKVKDGRILNPVKALRSVHADVVETIDANGNKTLLTGRIISGNSDDSFDIGGKNFPRRLLRKVAKVSDKKYLLYQIADGREAFADKEELGYLFAENEITFENAADLSRSPIPANTITDIVFAHMPYWSE